MTPQGSEQSEELPSSEEEHSVSVPSSSSTVNNIQIRVKNVSEINSNEAEANPSPPNKRKLPSWMRLSSQQSEDSVANKKAKTLPNGSNQNASTNSACDDQPESSEVILHVSDTDLNYSTNNLNGQNAEIDTNDDHEACARADLETPSASTSNAENKITPVAAIKAEPTDSEDNQVVGVIKPASSKDIKPAVKVEKTEATSSTTRPTCRFGIRCYRQNPTHRQEEAHPGDKDYSRPDFPAPPDGTPDCPYGNLCYRRNPVHFQQYSHPPSTDFAQNYKNYKMKLRKRKQSPAAANSSYSDLDDDEDNYDFEDPFINDDSEDEFIPNSLDYDDDEDDDL